MDTSTKLIFEYITRIQKETEIDNILLLLSKMARELIGSDRCTLWLYDDVDDIFWTKIAHGLSNEIKIPSDQGIVGLARKENKSFIVNDPYSHPSFNHTIDAETGYKTNNIMVVPLTDKQNNVIGIYQAINKLNGDFGEDDISYLTIVSVYSLEIIEKALLLKEIEETQKEVIFRMGDIAEAKSRETGNHIKRVAEFARMLAKGYGLDDNETELIVLASPMHDIGKIAIPDAILHKPGRLTPEEFDVIKTHTTVGYDLLKFSKRKILKTAAVIAHEHHEKWTGGGYPQNISGEDIHVYGRIIAIADVFDALSSDRCYKKAWDIERVVGLFKEERGRHFDPEMTDIFFDHLADFIEVKRVYAD
jgi:response regulator RpfG family c-di-GMP phosphodiesterase